MPEGPRSDDLATSYPAVVAAAGAPAGSPIQVLQWFRESGYVVDEGERIVRVTWAMPGDKKTSVEKILIAPIGGLLVSEPPIGITSTPVNGFENVKTRCYFPGDPIFRIEQFGSTMPRPMAESPVREPPAEIRTAMTETAGDGHGVFISYRRSDEAAFAGRLYDRLVSAFDKSTVFMDVDSIDLGLDFVDVLHDALSKCRVVVVVIGRSWLTSTDEMGSLRLESPDDFVRLEVEAALERKLRVIPVLVDGAPMPRSTSLPPSMATLARRNGREISNARFGSDTIELINTLRRILGRETED